MRISGLVLLSLLAGAVVGTVSAQPPPPRVEASMSVDFSELNDQGEWIYVSGYGTVWRPYADRGWRPFQYGRWVYSDDGWLWDSDEPFGWIVCHYGNWYHDDDEGWVWVPGYDWSPARVEWYVTDNEIAWAPLFPPPIPGRPRVSVNAYWNFVPSAQFTSDEVYSHVTVRARPARSSATVQVRVGPPGFEFVQRFAPRPIVRVAPRRVQVASRQHPLVRVEVESRARPSVVIPIGPRFRRTTVVSEPAPRANVTVTHEVQAAPKRSVTVTREVEVQPAPRRSVTVTNQVEVQPARSVEPARVRVVPPPQPPGLNKARVKGDDEDKDNDNDNGQGKKRVKVRSRDE